MQSESNWHVRQGGGAAFAPPLAKRDMGRGLGHKHISLAALVSPTLPIAKFMPEHPPGVHASARITACYSRVALLLTCFNQCLYGDVSDEGVTEELWAATFETVAIFDGPAIITGDFSSDACFTMQRARRKVGSSPPSPSQPFMSPNPK